VCVASGRRVAGRVPVRTEERTLMIRTATAALIALGLPAALAVAAPSPIADIAGDWSGKGTVRRDDASKPINVTCQMTGEQSASTLGFEGECRALLVMKRPIGATFKIDGDRVTGTYTGSSAGVAKLSGRATSATEWKLTMTFPKEINGDNVAEMTIRNSGTGTFQIVTTDKMTSGATVTTTDVTFTKK
jgi:hypothetical protein